MKQDDDSKGLKAICKECFYNPDCSLKPSSGDRCNVFLKNKKIEMGDDVSTNPMDTMQMSYEDLKELIEDLDIERE